MRKMRRGLAVAFMRPSSEGLYSFRQDSPDQVVPSVTNACSERQLKSTPDESCPRSVDNRRERSSIGIQTNVLRLRIALETSAVSETSAWIADETQTFEDRSDNGCRPRFNYDRVRSLPPRNLLGRMLGRIPSGVGGLGFSAGSWRHACPLSPRPSIRSSFRRPGKLPPIIRGRCRLR